LSGACSPSPPTRPTRARHAYHDYRDHDQEDGELERAVPSLRGDVKIRSIKSMRRRTCGETERVRVMACARLRGLPLFRRQRHRRKPQRRKQKHDTLLRSLRKSVLPRKEAVKSSRGTSQRLRVSPSRQTSSTLGDVREFACRQTRTDNGLGRLSLCGGESAAAWRFCGSS
jgi:hypothetical protein